MSSKKGLLISVVILACLAGTQVSAEGAVSDTSTPIINKSQPTYDTTTPNVTPTPETPTTDVETPSTDVTTPETPVNPDQGSDTDSLETTIPEKPNVPGEEGTPNTGITNPSNPNEGKENPTNPSNYDKDNTTTSTEDKYKPSNPSSSNQDQSITPTTPSTDIGVTEVIIPRPTSPVVTETGENIVFTQNGFLVLDNGTVITPESIGGRINSNNTITVKDVNGKELNLPSTNTIASSILSSIGGLIFTLVVLFGYYNYSDKTKNGG